MPLEIHTSLAIHGLAQSRRRCCGRHAYAATTRVEHGHRCLLQKYEKVPPGVIKHVTRAVVEMHSVLDEQMTAIERESKIDSLWLHVRSRDHYAFPWWTSRAMPLLEEGEKGGH